MLGYIEVYVEVMRIGNHRKVDKMLHITRRRIALPKISG